MRPAPTTQRRPLAVLAQDIAEPFGTPRRELDFVVRTPARAPRSNTRPWAKEPPR